MPGQTALQELSRHHTAREHREGTSTAARQGELCVVCVCLQVESVPLNGVSVCMGMDRHQRVYRRPRR